MDTDSFYICILLLMNLHPTLSNHAVLQRDRLISIWGFTDPDAKVEVSLAGEKAIGKSNAQGEFMIKLPPMSAGGPFELKVHNVDSGDQKVVKDLLVGDVWLASGQSNMEWGMKDCLYHEQIKEAKPEQIRMLTASREARLTPNLWCEGEWQVSSPETQGSFSAVATFFGERIRKEVGVPVGIINSCWGGTCIEAWSSSESLAMNSDMTPLQHFSDKNVYSPSWMDRVDDEMTPDPGISKNAKGWSEVDHDDGDWEVVTKPMSWQQVGHKGLKANSYPSATVIFSINMKEIAGGLFDMGSSDNVKGDEDLRSVVVSPFKIDVYEISQKEYFNRLGERPTGFDYNDFYPVESVTWYDAVLFCNARSKSYGF